jgi:Transposase and inactivated derivatives
MSQLTCKKCQSERFVKSGHTRGHQRYQCKDCGCQFTNTKHRGVHPALRSFAIVLYAYCGVSMGKIARLYKISTVAVLKWIKTAALDAKPINPVSESDIVMIDEIWHFVNGKKIKYGSGEPLMGYRVNLLDGNWAIVAMPAHKDLSQK